MVYRGVVRKLLKEIKFRGTYDMVRELAGIWKEKVKIDVPMGVVTNVPMFSKKKRERGFDQAELIARELARQWEVPYQELIIRTRATRPMYGLSKVERARNIANAFEVRQDVKGVNLCILVDDVWTTGATMRECAGVLRRAGIKEIRMVAMAR